MTSRPTPLGATAALIARLQTHNSMNLCKMRQFPWGGQPRPFILPESGCSVHFGETKGVEWKLGKFFGKDLELHDNIPEGISIGRNHVVCQDTGNIFTRILLAGH